MREPQLEDYYDISDPRGCSTSEFNEYEEDYRNYLKINNMTEEKCIQGTEVITQGRLQSLLHNMETNSTSLIEVIRRLQETCQRIGLDVNYEDTANICLDKIWTGSLNNIDQENKLQITLLEYIFKLTVLLEGL